MGIAIILVFVKWKELPRLPAVAKPLTRSVLFLTALAVLTAPLSVWPGASVAFLYQQLPVLGVAVLIGYKISVSWSHFRKIGRVLTISAVVLV